MICGDKSVKMEEFYGKKYVMVDSEHFEDLMKFLGKSFVERKLGMTLKPVQYVASNEDGTYTIHFHTTMVNTEVVFTPGVEFIETKSDGSMVRTIVTIDGNKVTHRQVEDNGRTLNHVYEFFPDKMVVTTTSPGLDHVVKRNYLPVK